MKNATITILLFACSCASAPGWNLRGSLGGSSTTATARNEEGRATGRSSGPEARVEASAPTSIDPNLSVGARASLGFDRVRIAGEELDGERYGLDVVLRRGFALDRVGDWSAFGELSVGPRLLDWSMDGEKGADWGARGAIGLGLERRLGERASAFVQVEYGLGTFDLRDLGDLDERGAAAFAGVEWRF